METGLDLRVTELLCSRLCHDLIGPVSALSNGLELLADDDGSGIAEIASLLRLSAGQASGRLTFFRMAYGFGGEAADTLTLAEAGALVQGIADGDKVTLRWPEDHKRALGRVGTKLVLNAAAIGLESLPRGGCLSLVLEDGGAGAVVAAEGPEARLRPETAEGMDEGAEVGSLTPRSVHGYFTRWLAHAHGGGLEAAAAADAVRLRLRLPPR